MNYKVLKIVRISGHHYEADYEEITWFRKPKIFKRVMTEFSSTLGVVVSTGAYLHNFRQILEAYDFCPAPGIDFTQRSEPLPRVQASGKAIY